MKKYTILLLLTLLSSCAYIRDQTPLRDKTHDYRQAESYPALHIPASMQRRLPSDHYAIPDVAVQENNLEDLNIEPPDFAP